MDTEVRYFSAYENYLLGNFEGTLKVLEECHNKIFKCFHVSSAGIVYEHVMYDDNDKIWNLFKENGELSKIEFEYKG